MSDIQGWFDFEDIYSRMVELAPPGAHFVEVGSWLGKSAHFMGTRIRESGKDIRFDCVDIWAATPQDPYYHKDIERLGDIYQIFLSNTKGLPITPVRMDSVKAAALYKDQSLDFVFIDANHQYEYVCKDIQAWLPKIKPKGFIGGHDYNIPDVKRAVNEIMDNVQSLNISWLCSSTTG